MTGPSRITTVDGETTVLDSRFGFSIRGRSISEVEQEQRRLAAGGFHNRAVQRWQDDGSREPREVAA